MGPDKPFGKSLNVSSLPRLSTSLLGLKIQQLWIKLRLYFSLDVSIINPA